jgi:hypothetical protein
MSVEQTGTWPRRCMCNDCGHLKIFDDYETMFATPCEQCGGIDGETDGGGYCACDMCAAAVTP